MGILEDHNPVHRPSHATLAAWRKAGFTDNEAAIFDSVAMLPSDAADWDLLGMIKEADPPITIAAVFALGVDADEGRGWVSYLRFWSEDDIDFHRREGWTPKQANAFGWALVMHPDSRPDNSDEMRATWLGLGLSPQVTVDAVALGMSPQEALAADPQAVLTLGALAR